MTLKLCSIGGKCVSAGKWWKATALNVHGVDNVRQTAVQGTHEVPPPSSVWFVTSYRGCGYIGMLYLS
jgi:hypothetical protein